LPVVPTFITNSRAEALEFINKTAYPLISKITTGSSSFGVFKIKNKRSAFRYVNYCFSNIGKKTYWPFVRQINYVYFQQFVGSAKYDLRIIVVGNKIFGYYRYPKAGDFRASGAGNVEKKALPEEAMKIAIKVKEEFKSTSLAVDMIYSEEEQKYYIIETSVFCGIDTAEQLVIDGKPGYYEYDGENFTFKEGRFWFQELALQDYFNKFLK
jgi:glutathione synthase/RimK-type ligase-like ATP-grasp enzyme